jgi:hypothetical protein
MSGWRPLPERGAIRAPANWHDMNFAEPASLNAVKHASIRPRPPPGAANEVTVRPAARLRVPLLRLLPALALLLSALAAPGADAGGAPKASPNQPAKADAQGVFAKQAAAAGTVAPGPLPRIAGSYIWSGRADETYKPFFQWELRLAGGTTAVAGLSMRLTTLGPDRKPLVAGPWKPLGSLAAGMSRDVDYKLNCPNFPAYQIELSWQGGKESFIGWDKFAVPAGLGDLATSSFVVTLNQNAEYADAARTATVTWMLWNLGAQPAHDVVQTVRFLDDKGREVAKADYKPENGEVAAGLIKEQRFVAKKIPPYATIMVVTKLSDAATLSTLDGGAFTGAKDVEVAKIHVEGKQLKARVRNGTGIALSGVVVSITLQNKDGKAVKQLELPVGKLAPDEERDLAADLSGVGSWIGYEVGWHNEAASASASAP